ncbi:MAG: DUF1893 domain-containing protein [Calditrichaeota bacterium]|nr:DUF1893 domain-containing protein [Calditrichota bacterium]
MAPPDKTFERPDEERVDERIRHSLEVRHAGRLVFVSDGKWLHPLFELETFLQEHTIPPGELVVHDKIVGRAAALLLVYLGVSRVVADLLSRGGQEVLEHYKVSYQFVTLVDRILCRTEELLAHELDPARAHRMLLELARGGSSTGQQPPSP